MDTFDMLVDKFFPDPAQPMQTARRITHFATL
jgi:hypothetical protein